MHDGWMFGMGWGWILVLLTLGFVVWLLLRAAGRSRPSSMGSSPEELLKQRLARGEIGEDEYRRRLEALGHRS